MNIFSKEPEKSKYARQISPHRVFHHAGMCTTYMSSQVAQAMLRQTSLLFDEQTCEACHAVGDDNVVVSLVLPRGLIALFLVEHWKAILEACEGKSFICIGFPRLDISFKTLSRAFSSDRIRYY